MCPRPRNSRFPTSARLGLGRGSRIARQLSDLRPGPRGGRCGRSRPAAPRGRLGPTGLSSGVSSGVCAVATGGSGARSRAGASHTNTAPGGPPAEARAGASSSVGVSAGYALWPARAPRLQWVVSAGYALGDGLARAPLTQTPLQGVTPAEARAGASSSVGVSAGYALWLARAPRLQWVVSAGYALGEWLARASRPVGGILEAVEESVSTDDGRREMYGG